MKFPSYTIERLYALHKEHCPDSQLSKRAIRRAVDSGELPSISVGNRCLIRLDCFEDWQRGGTDGKR